MIRRDHPDPGPGRALARAYGLLATLVLRGPDDTALARLASVPGAPTPGALEELRAGHHRAFQMEAFPQAGVFLSAEARAGASSDLVADFHRRLGFAPRLDDVTEDHLGIQLAFLSFATAAATEAALDGDPRRSRIETVLVEYLDRVVLRWVPSLTVALQATAVPFWPEVVELAVGLAAHHRHLAGPPPATDPFPPAAAILDDARTDLRRIARFLLTPAECGALMTRTDVTELGRAHTVPRGFGPRLTLLTNLLHSAVDLGELPAIADGLGRWARDRAAAMEALGRATGLPGAVAPWVDRLGHTARLMKRLAEAGTAPAVHLGVPPDLPHC